MSIFTLYSSPDYIKYFQHKMSIYLCTYSELCANKQKSSARSKKKPSDIQIYLFFITIRDALFQWKCYLWVYISSSLVFMPFVTGFTFTKWIVYKLLEFEMKDDGVQFNVPCRVREFIFYQENATVGVPYSFFKIKSEAVKLEQRNHTVLDILYSWNVTGWVAFLVLGHVLRQQIDLCSPFDDDAALLAINARNVKGWLTWQLNNECNFYKLLLPIYVEKFVSLSHEINYFLIRCPC